MRFGTQCSGWSVHCVSLWHHHHLTINESGNRIGTEKYRLCNISTVFISAITLLNIMLHYCTCFHCITFSVASFVAGPLHQVVIILKTTVCTKKVVIVVTKWGGRGKFTKLAFDDEDGIYCSHNFIRNRLSILQNLCHHTVYKYIVTKYVWTYPNICMILQSPLNY